MKNLNYLVMGLMVSTLGLNVACDDENDNINGEGNGDGNVTIEEPFTDILETYVDKTVLSTYSEMKDRAWILFEKVSQFKTDGTQTSLDAACEAWRNTREPWEKSEAFLFGPADFNRLDPMLDSWPLDEPQIRSVLEGNSDLSDGGILGENVRGFHTLEYLLFENGEERNAADITERQKDYMYIVAQLLRNDCIQLWAGWHGTDGISEKDQEVIDEFEISMPSPESGYAFEFKNAGKKGSRIMSQSNAIEQIVDGCMDIAGEVSEQKIGTPFHLVLTDPQAALYQVESWYSWNSLIDYENNIISIENSYFGGIQGNRGASLSEFIREKDSALDQEITNAIQTARNEIHKIVAPFRNSLKTDREQIEKAINACAVLSSSLEKIKRYLDY